MSGMEHPQSESRSSVAVKQNAKGEPSIEVKVYAATGDVDAIDEAADKMVAIYKRLLAEVGA